MRVERRPLKFSPLICLLPTHDLLSASDMWRTKLMAVLSTGYEHIILDEKGVPIIEGTNMKVVELALEAIAYGWSPDESHFQHPYLSLGQIHSALAYYWDHTEELDQDIERRMKNAERIRQTVGASVIKDKLKAKGFL